MEPTAKTTPNGASPETPDTKADQFANVFLPDEDLPFGTAVRISMPVDRPDAQTFFRVSPLEDHQRTVALVRASGGSDFRSPFYLIAPGLIPLVQAEARRYRLLLTVSLQGAARWWPIPMAKKGREPSIWTTTALHVAQLAQTQWVRILNSEDAITQGIASDGGGYVPFFPDVPIDVEPNFPLEPVTELLRLAFGQRFVDRRDHPLILKLRRGVIVNDDKATS